MQVAETRVVLNKLGSDVPKMDVTPSEAMFLHILHGPANGGKTFTEKMDNFKIVGDAMVKEGDKTRPRTAAEELVRLRAKYNQARTKENKPVIDLIWPDKLNPKMPETFKEINWQQLAASTQGIEVAPLNYVTGAPAMSQLPGK